MTEGNVMTTPPVLSARHLKKSYGHVRALRGVSVDIVAGEVLALVGDNGAGKSTLVKTLAAVHAPDEGQILVEGRPSNFNSPLEARRAGIEVVFQDLALAPDLPVWGNIFLGREVSNQSRVGKIVRWLDKATMRRQSSQELARLGIDIQNVNTVVDELSGGQRQAVAVARSTTWGSRCVIMDEPTNNLGVPEQLKVLGLIRTLAEHDVGVMVVSHNLHHIFEIADRIVVLRHGSEVASKRVDETDYEDVVAYITGAKGRLSDG